MTRLIEADEIIKRSHDVIIGNGTKHRCFDTTLIHEIPTVDAEPVRHGKWMPREEGAVYPFWERYTCSACGKHADDTEYCPHCGARMDEDETD